MPQSKAEINFIIFGILDGKTFSSASKRYNIEMAK